MGSHGRQGLTRLTWTSPEVWLALTFAAGMFEGAARKWILPASPAELGYLAYLSKFAFLGMLCLLATLPVRRPVAGTFGAALGGGGFLLALGAAISALEALSLTGAFLTTLMTLVAPALALAASGRLVTVDLTRVARWVVCLSVIPAGIGLLQFQLAPDHAINKFVGDGGGAIEYLGRSRASGTFSFISGMAVMTVVGTWLGLFLRCQSSVPRDRLLGLAGIGAGLLCGLVALSRGGVFLAIALIGARIVFGGRDRQLVAAFLAGVLALGYVVFEDRLGGSGQATVTTGVFQRHAESDSVGDRLTSWIDQAGLALDAAPLGAGFGTGQVGGAVIETGRYRLRSYEGEIARLIQEVGFIGLLGVLWIRIGCLYALFGAALRMRPGASRDGVVLCGLATGAMLIGNTAFNHVAAGFVWPIVAIGLALADREILAERYRRAEAARRAWVAESST